MLSVVPQRPNLDFALNARQILLFHAAYHGVPTAERNRRADALLEQFGLSDRGGDKVLQFSGGMTQRLLIARALMHAPDVIFLDEPSTVWTRRLACSSGTRSASSRQLASRWC